MEYILWEVEKEALLLILLGGQYSGLACMLQPSWKTQQ